MMCRCTFSFLRKSEKADEARCRPKSTFALLKVLSETLGQSYVEMALETAQSRHDAVDSKSEPALHILSVVKAVDLICHLWQQYINIALLPLASSSVTTRREIVQFNTQTINRIESATNNVLQRMADCECPHPHYFELIASYLLKLSLDGSPYS